MDNFILLLVFCLIITIWFGIKYFKVKKYLPNTELKKDIKQRDEEIGELKTKLKTNEKLYEEAENKLKEKEEKQKKLINQKKSSEVLTGKVVEQIAPFLDGFKHDPRNARFIGAPIDYIIFDDEEIIFLEVKSRNSTLTSKQKKIKNQINSGKVRWEELHITGITKK